MAEGVEAGAALAWRLLATLEGGTIVLATSALIAYTTRRKLVRRSRKYRPVKNVLITNTANELGRELQLRLSARGCSVRTLSGGGGATGVDCLVVIGAECTGGLDGLSRLVTEDVYNNLHLLESLSPYVSRGGSIVWATAGGSAGAGGGAYRGAACAFRAVVRAALLHVAKLSHCEPVWVEGHSTAEEAIQKILDELFPCTTHDTFSFRYATHMISKFLYGWLNVVS